MNFPVDVEEYIDFNKRMYSNRKNTPERLVNWRLKLNPFLQDIPEDLFVNSHGRIIGQIIPIGSIFTSGTKQYTCVWGSDYIVDEEHRGSPAGVKVLRNIFRHFLHFGVGMSDVSLKMHQILGEKEYAVRFDYLFIAGKKSSSPFKYLSIDEFLELFPKKLNQTYQSAHVNYFKRDIDFYRWSFKYSNRAGIAVVLDPETNAFTVFYDTKIKRLPVHKIVDYSPNLFENQELFAKMIRDYGSRSFKRLFFYSGSIDFTNYFKLFRYKKFPVYSNISRKQIKYHEDYPAHITGLDSDRFINSFL